MTSPPTPDTPDSPAAAGPDAWVCCETGFTAPDQTRLFYRAWQPRDTRRSAAAPPLRVLVFLHGDGGDSAQLQGLVRELVGLQDWAFAWDARGHGHSHDLASASAPAHAGDALARQVQDFDAFTRHLRQTHNLSTEDMFLVAHGSGGLVATAWMHDHAPSLRGAALVATTFRYKGHTRWTSLARQRATTAHRLIANASAIDIPVLVLAAEQDHIAAAAPQQRFHAGLASLQKRWGRIAGADHTVLLDLTPPLRAPQETAVRTVWRFIEVSYGQPMSTPEERIAGDQNSHSATQFRHLERGALGSVWQRVHHACRRWGLHQFGPISDGLRLGLEQGFDAGAALDHAYRDTAGGRSGLGRWLDQRHLASVDSRALRQRQGHLQQLLCELIAAHPAHLPLRILDVASGGGRYVLESAKRFQDRPMRITLQDTSTASLALAAALADQLGLEHPVEYHCRDALVPDSYPVDEAIHDIVVVSGLYERISDNAPVLASLQGIRQQLRPGGHLVYTGLPWHPHWLRIGQTLPAQGGVPLQWRQRPQAELDALVATIDCRKTHSLIGLDGIGSVSVARHEPPPPKSITEE